MNFRFLSSKKMTATTLLVALSSAFSTAHAAEEVTSRFLFNCNMSFKIEGTSAYLGVGGTSAEGKGHLSCYDYVTGAVQDIPLNVKVKGLGLGLGVTGFNITGGKAGFGLNAQPESLLGSYARVSANGAIGVGGEVGGGLRMSFSKGGSFEVSAILAGRSGLGVGVEVSELFISRDDQAVDSKPAIAPAIQPTAPPVVAAEIIPAPTAAVAQNQTVSVAANSASLPIENITLPAQGSEILVLNSKGQAVKRLKVFIAR